MNEIKMTRGDTLPLKFKRLDANGDVIVAAPDAMFLTFKNDFNSRQPIFQKKLSDFTEDNDGTWHVKILPQDTERLPYGTYAFDVEVIVEELDYVFTPIKGTITLEREATWSVNKNE